jgi:RNA-directed DNA polymerase
MMIKKLIIKDWYKRKKYLHFDYALDRDEAGKFVSDSSRVVRHNFSPFIHYVKESRRYRRDKKTRKLKVAVKTRHICFTAHLDGYIYSYYNQMLAQYYENFLNKEGLANSIIAYRRIEKLGERYCNIHMAREAIDYIKQTKECRVLCLDITSFFDSLCPDILKQNWCSLLQSERLPDDHYAVYKGLVNFSYVEEQDCIDHFGVNPRRSKDADSRNENICSFAGLRDVHKSHRIIKKKSDLGVIGIPQGSPISGLAANIFMMQFDCSVKAYCESLQGFYRRYSDDIFIAFPVNKSFGEVREKIEKILKEASKEKLEFNQDKTEERFYWVDDDGIGHVEEGTRNIQYLGFVFDGQKVHIRNSSVSKNRAQIAKTVWKNKKDKVRRAAGINTRAVYKDQSLKKMSPYDKKNKRFVGYGIRANKIMQEVAILNQLKKNDRYIKKKIKENRPRLKRHKAEEAKS